MSASTDARPGLAAILPIAAAIGTFGIIFGASARPVLGSGLTLASSLLMFSGAAQFAMVAMLAGGASAVAVLWAITVLNLRHLALGAVVRARLGDVRTGRRAWLAWFLIDESVGLALSTEDGTADTLRRAGGLFYAAWVLGTVVGLAGASVPGVEPLAAAVFRVLFVGLTAVTAAGRSDVVRSAVAAGLVLLLLPLLPGAGGLVPVLAATAVAMIGERS